MHYLFIVPFSLRSGDRRRRRRKNRALPLWFFGRLAHRGDGCGTLDFYGPRSTLCHCHAMTCADIRSSARTFDGARANDDWPYLCAVRFPQIYICIKSKWNRFVSGNLEVIILPMLRLYWAPNKYRRCLSTGVRNRFGNGCGGVNVCGRAKNEANEVNSRLI